jgi:hypothetical protein
VITVLYEAKQIIIPADRLWMVWAFTLNFDGVSIRDSIVFSNCTNKKGKKIVLIYVYGNLEAVPKSYMRKGFLVYEEMRKFSFIISYMRRPLVFAPF